MYVITKNIEKPIVYVFTLRLGFTIKDSEEIHKCWEILT